MHSELPNCVLVCRHAQRQSPGSVASAKHADRGIKTRHRLNLMPGHSGSNLGFPARTNCHFLNFFFFGLDTLQRLGFPEIFFTETAKSAFMLR